MMASITISVSGATVGEVTITEMIEGRNSDRFVAWLIANHGKNDDGSLRTAKEAVAACWASIRSGIFAGIERYDADLAMEAARASISPMQSVTEIE